MSTKDEDYEHWPDNDKLAALNAAPAPRYDSHNGLYEHTYRPAGEVKKDAPAPPAAAEVKKDEAPPQQYAQYVQYPPQTLMMGYGGPQMMPGGIWYAPNHYGYGAYPPAYLGVPNYTTTQPAAAPVEDATPKDKPAKEKKDSKAPSPRKWQGRTRAEVEEDDMKLAASEGAYAARKVVPLGLEDDQVVWVVEVDQSTVLRTFAEVQGLKGEWKADPRFKDSWYFVREAENGKEKK